MTKHRAQKDVQFPFFSVSGCFGLLVVILLGGMYALTFFIGKWTEIAIKGSLFIAGVLGLAVVPYVLKKYFILQQIQELFFSIHFKKEWDKVYILTIAHISHIMLSHKIKN